MNAETRFAGDVLELLDREHEVEVETRSPAGEVHRTIIWIVVEGGEVFIRSLRGAAGRWYRELVSDPSGAVHAARQRIPVHAAPADDEASIARCSRALAQKYGRGASVRAMLRGDVLGTTLRLEPG